jgi:photosystem II stability/assembly factor-like uncharacterized protein
MLAAALVFAADALPNGRTARRDRISTPRGPVKQPSEFFQRQRAFPFHEIPTGAYANAVRQARAFEGGARGSSALWEQSGPTNVGGRVTAIAVHPTTPSVLWIGAADGGILKTTNSGTNWTPLTDDFGSLSIGALAIHPTDPTFLLAGTGEANASGDSYDGIGILKTTDGGNTWAVTGLPESQRIGRIAFDPVNPSRIHVAVSGSLFTKGPQRGMYRSTDAGATWHQTLFVSDSTSAIDVAVHPTDGNIVYAAFWERLRRPNNRKVGGPTSRIWKSTNGGDTWSVLSTGLPAPGPAVGRIGLAIAKSLPTTVYAVYADDPGFFDGVYRSTNSGANWARVDDGSDLSDVYSSFGWYFGNIRVSPSNANTIFVLGLDLARSTNAGSSWSFITQDQHVDFHDLAIVPGSPGLFISGNDGGVYSTTNSGGAWAKKPDLPITQFYAITVDPQLPHRIYGGTQDNSTPRTLTGALDDWDILIGGDGFTCIVDPTNSNIIYGEYQYGGLQKSINGGASFFDATSGVGFSDRINWHMPFVMDPNNPQRLYLGTHRVYRSTNGAGNWTAISPDLTDGSGGGNLVFGTMTTLAVAPSAPGTVYAGSDDGNVHVTTNDGGSWTEIDTGLPLRWVTRVAVDPGNAAIAYVTFSGYKQDDFLPHVFRTTNFGGMWTDISSNLPEVPINDLIVDPENTSRLYIATDVGVFTTTDLGGTWDVLGTGLPASVVADLELHDETRTLVAGTHGRSSFTISIEGAVDAPVSPSVLASLNFAAPSPNPSRGPVTFSFALPRESAARLTVHDVAGRVVRTLWNGPADGDRTVVWDRRDDAGQALAAGVYFARLEAEGAIATKSITLLR